MTPAAERGYRLLFRLAAVYNLAFFAWTLLAPERFLSLLGVTPTDSTSVLAQCIGMIVGVYGIAYGYVASHLERGDVLVGVGLLGKVLGPVGWAWSFHEGVVPEQSFLLVLCNDLIWWPGFALYLLRGREHRRRRAALLFGVMAATHGLGSGALGVLPGSGARLHELVAVDPQVAWTLGWALWCLGDLFSPAFVWVVLRAYAGRLPLHGPGARAVLASVVLASAGDLVLNASYAARGVVPATWPFPDTGLRTLSLVGANGLFLVGYVVLSFLLWRARSVSRTVTSTGLLAWVGALGLVVHGLGVATRGLPLSGALFTTGFLVWLTALYVEFPE